MPAAVRPTTDNAGSVYFPGALRRSFQVCCASAPSRCPILSFRCRTSTQRFSDPIVCCRICTNPECWAITFLDWSGGDPTTPSNSYHRWEMGSASQLKWILAGVPRTPSQSADSWYVWMKAKPNTVSPWTLRRYTVSYGSGGVPTLHDMHSVQMPDGYYRLEDVAWWNKGAGAYQLIAVSRKHQTLAGDGGWVAPEWRVLVSDDGGLTWVASQFALRWAQSVTGLSAGQARILKNTAGVVADSFTLVFPGPKNLSNQTNQDCETLKLFLYGLVELLPAPVCRWHKLKQRRGYFPQSRCTVSNRGKVDPSHFPAMS